MVNAGKFFGHCCTFLSYLRWVLNSGLQLINQIHIYLSRKEKDKLNYMLFSVLWNINGNSASLVSSLTRRRPPVSHFVDNSLLNFAPRRSHVAHRGPGEHVSEERRVDDKDSIVSSYRTIRQSAAPLRHVVPSDGWLHNHIILLLNCLP
jgi:hypothetical protein